MNIIMSFGSNAERDLELHCDLGMEPTAAFLIGNTTHGHRP